MKYSLSGLLATFSVWDKPQSKHNQTCEGGGLKGDQAGNRYPETIFRIFKKYPPQTSSLNNS